MRVITTSMTREEILTEAGLKLGDVEVRLADGFEAAAIGVTAEGEGGRVVHSYQKALRVLMQRDGMTRAEAAEFLDYNLMEAAEGRDHCPLWVDMFEAVDGFKFEVGDRVYVLPQGLFKLSSMVYEVGARALRGGDRLYCLLCPSDGGASQPSVYVMPTMYREALLTHAGGEGDQK